MVAHMRPLKNWATWKNSFSVNSCPFLALVAVNPIFYEAWINNDLSTGSLSGIWKSWFLLVTLLVENGCQQKHIAQRINNLTSKVVKPSQTRSISSHTTWEKTIHTFWILSGNGRIRIFETRNWYPKFRNILRTCLYTEVFIPKERNFRFSEIEKPNNTLKIILKWPCNW